MWIFETQLWEQNKGSRTRILLEPFWYMSNKKKQILLENEGIK